MEDDGAAGVGGGEMEAGVGEVAVGPRGQSQEFIILGDLGLDDILQEAVHLEDIQMLYPNL